MSNVVKCILKTADTLEESLIYDKECLTVYTLFILVWFLFGGLSNMVKSVLKNADALIRIFKKLRYRSILRGR